TASVLNSPPVHLNKGFSFHTSAAMDVHKLLFPKNLPFCYVPEEALVADDYSLDQHQVIIIPQGPYLPTGVTDRLLNWVRQGGTLISIGPPGIWNPYGQPNQRLMDRAFGPCLVTDKTPGRWNWSWHLRETG